MALVDRAKTSIGSHAEKVHDRWFVRWSLIILPVAAMLLVMPLSRWAWWTTLVLGVLSIVSLIIGVILQPKAIVRYILVLTALGFLTLFLILPLAAVFAEALAKGWKAYFPSLRPRRNLGRAPAYAAYGGDLRAAQSRLRRGGSVDDRQV